MFKDYQGSLLILATHDNIMMDREGCLRRKQNNYSYGYRETQKYTRGHHLSCSLNLHHTDTQRSAS